MDSRRKEIIALQKSWDLKELQISILPPKSNKVPEKIDIIAEEANIVGDFFWPIIWLLKFVGNCPLSYVYTEGVSFDNRNHAFALPKRCIYREYKMHYTSPFTLFCFVQGILALTVWVFNIYEIFTDERIFNIELFSPKAVLSKYMGGDSSGFEGTAIEFMIRTLVCSTPVIQLLEVVLSWAESKDFGKFLNNFHQLQREYLEAFPFIQHLPQQNLNRVRNMVLLFYVLVPTLIGLPMLLYLANLSEFSVIGVCVTVILIVGVTFVSLLEDLKVLLAYYILGEAFRQIRSSIIYSLNNWGKVTPKKVHSWRRIIHETRQQANFVANCQKYHQLMLIIASIILVTGLTFAILTETKSTPTFWYFLIAQISNVVMIVGRLYLKIYLATLISQEESMIARELVLANFPQNEPAIQLEVKFLHDMIKQKPCLIKYGTYVTLDKNLILGIGSQIVTYIIALLQFPSLSYRA